MTARSRFVTWAGLAVVLAAAAILSFSGLAGLAEMVGIRQHLGLLQLSWLLPVCTDAGVAVSTAVWLSRRHNVDAERFAQQLTWALLLLTVAGNATHQGLAAAGVQPAWWVAVLVGAIPPGVVGAVVHLSVLVGRATSKASNSPATLDLAGQKQAAPSATAPPPDPSPGPLLDVPPVGEDQAAAQPEPVRLHLAKTETAAAKARRLVAQGASQAEIQAALGLPTRHKARQLQEQPERAEEFIARWTASS